MSTDAAGADWVEITPAMLEAGVLEWAIGDPEFESPSEIVERIYRAMIALSTHGKSTRSTQR